MSTHTCDKVDGSVVRISDKECEANAALIASAPDLLAMLERIWAFASHEDAEVDADTDWDAVMTLIAKARGGK